MIMLDAVAPQKYRVEPGEVSRSTITATKDVMDQVSYEAACKAARDSVSAIYRIDDEKRVSVINAVTDDFAKVEDARAQAIAQRNDWLKENPGSTMEQHQFSSKFISMLMGNLSDISYASTANERLNEDDMLVIINTNLKDIDAVKAYIKERIDGVMAAGLSDEELPGKRNEIIAALNKDEAYSAVNSVIKKVAWLILIKDLSANYSLDETATDEAKLAAAAEVSQGSYLYKQGQTIVRSGDIVTQAHIAMLEELGMLENDNVDIKLISRSCAAYPYRAADIGLLYCRIRAQNDTDAQKGADAGYTHSAFRALFRAYIPVSAGACANCNMHRACGGAA